MRNWSSLTLFCLLTLLMAACRTQTDTPTSTTVVTVVETHIITPTPLPTSTPTPVPSPTPVPAPFLVVQAQKLGDEGTLEIAEIQANEAGWVALFAQDQWLGSVKVPAGHSADLLITVDKWQLAEEVTARLYAGQGRTFDPAKAELVMVAGQPVETTFVVELDLALPLLIIDDQDVPETGEIFVQQVVMPEAGWLAIYSAESAEPLALQWLNAGSYAQLPLTILWREGSPTLTATLHRDLGQAEHFDGPDVDLPFSARQQPLETEFQATYLPDIVVYNQPVVSNTIVLDQILANQSGWVTVSAENRQRTIGNIIGFAPVQAGRNRFVTLSLVGDLATEVLYFQLHEDSGVIGEFDFPAADPAIRANNEPRYFTMTTTVGNYLLTSDQTIPLEDDKGEVRVPLVVGDVPMWVVVRLDDEGEFGPIIGRIALPAGVHRDILVPVEAVGSATRLHVVLHVDQGTLGSFDFPDGVDLELRRRLLPISAPMQLFP